MLFSSPVAECSQTVRGDSGRRSNSKFQQYFFDGQMYEVISRMKEVTNDLSPDDRKRDHAQNVKTKGGTSR